MTLIETREIVWHCYFGRISIPISVYQCKSVVKRRPLIADSGPLSTSHSPPGPVTVIVITEKLDAASTDVGISTKNDPGPLNPGVISGVVPAGAPCTATLTGGIGPP